MADRKGKPSASTKYEVSVLPKTVVQYKRLHLSRSFYSPRSVASVSLSVNLD